MGHLEDIGQAGKTYPPTKKAPAKKKAAAKKPTKKASK